MHARSLVSALILASLVSSCGDDGSAPEDASTPDSSIPTDAAPDSSTPPDGSADADAGPLPECPGVTGDSALGTACVSGSDCVSGACPAFTDAPADTSAVCERPAADCSTRFTGTVFDIRTRAPVADATVRIVGTLQAATSPATATPVATGATDTTGRFDFTSSGPITTTLGLVALVEATGYVRTATGVASPAEGTTDSYAPGNAVHDVWLLAEADADTWSAALASDPEIAPGLLPLYDSGGVVGLVRDASNDPVALATVHSTSAGSSAVVRYLVSPDTFATTATDASGIFVILDPSVPEEFEVRMEDMAVGSTEAATAPNVVFTAVVTI
jgi:hypothetical protein